MSLRHLMPISAMGTICLKIAKIGLKKHGIEIDQVVRRG